MKEKSKTRVIRTNVSSIFFLKKFFSIDILFLIILKIFSNQKKYTNT